MDSVTVTLIQLEKLSPARKEELNLSLNYLYKMHRTQIEELIERGCNVAFIPLGPTEVHGPHLPLWCDIVSGLDLAERAAKKLQNQGIESVIATPVTYCEAGVTNVFAGNTSLRPETVTMMFEDICLSLARAGFVNIIVVSGHADPLNAEYVVKGFEAAKVKNPAINAIYSDWFSMITNCIFSTALYFRASSDSEAFSNLYFHLTTLPLHYSTIKKTPAVNYGNEREFQFTLL